MDSGENTCFPSSIREINRLNEDQKRGIYSHLIPDWLFTYLDLSPLTLRSNRDDAPLVAFRFPNGSRVMELFVWRQLTDRDPVFYLNIADTFNNQLMVLLVVVNNPDLPRYNIDIDLQGNPTHFGTVSRNIPAELSALQAGLAPGQVREGLRGFRRSLPVFEAFVRCMGHDIFFIEPLAYHNAIIFERYGFNYITGRREMERINEGFQPGDVLHMRLDENNPFRSTEAWKSIRGRSWAIHDGILGHPFTGFQMYKRVSLDSGVNTFPDARW